MVLTYVSLLLIALLVRLIPASFSSLPYNIDAFPMARISINIMESGYWGYGGSGLVLYNSKMPVLPGLIAIVSEATGAHPFVVIRFLIPIIGATSILSAAFLVRHITKSREATIAASIFFALNGFFVYLTSAAMKEALGLSLMPIAYILFLKRNEGINVLFLALVLLAMIFVHHLTFLLLITILFLSSIYSIVNSYFLEGRGSIKKEIPTFTVVMISAISGWLYYYQSSLEHMQYVPLAERILLLFILVLWVLFGTIIMFSTDIANRSKSAFMKITLVIMLGVLILGVNFFVPIFGTIKTSSLLILMIIPYILLLIFPLIGFEVLRSSISKAKTLLLAGLVGPIVFMCYSIVSGLDAISFALLYRSYDYMDISLGVCAGIGLVYLLRMFNGKPWIKKTIWAAFLGLCLLTLPLAYNGYELYGVRDVTEDHEFTALEATADIALTYNLTVYTDQRLSDIIEPYFGVNAERSLPTTIKDSRNLPEDSILVLSATWMDTGAQIHPFPNLVITQSQWNRTLEQSTLLFHSGPPGSEIYVLRTP